MQNLKLKQDILGTFKNKIKILNTYNFLCEKFAAVCKNSAENLHCVSEKSCPPTFLTHDAVGLQSKIVPLHYTTVYNRFRTTLQLRLDLQ